MIEHFCDICKKPLRDEPYTNYKVKKEWLSWGESGWERLEVHDECWKILCREIAKIKDEVSE